MLNEIHQNKIIIYIDETSSNTNIVPLYGYSKAGQKFKVKVPPRGKNLSCVAAVTNDKILACQFANGSFKRWEFGIFMINLIN